ncbi:Glu/Leu/Phe/Val family dehydrogenase [Tamaricihabitans halophyticus]|nr:Glu/Leu/Phe/Val dehydrogenase dimerization domain-containing protein [Tamaricihabitans halophyticus]
MLRVTWTDPVTGKNGFLVVHNIVDGHATGGTRMRAGCTLSEVEGLAYGMSLKTTVFDLPAGGAKGGIDCDPKDPEAPGVLRRFLAAMRPWLDTHWVTAEDLGMPQEIIDEAFADLGMDQSYHAAIANSANPAETLQRVQQGLAASVPGGQLLGEVIGGYGVAQSCLGVAEKWGNTPDRTTVAVQGVGTMGGAAAWYLHEAGMRVVAIADAAGTLTDPQGLDIPALLENRNVYGEIDRSKVPDSVQQLPREAVLFVPVDILVPAAVSYAVTQHNVGAVAAKLVVEAANMATTPEAEVELANRGVPVLPDFVANAGAAAWAWWLLTGKVGVDPQDSFALLHSEMRSKVAELIDAWDNDRIAPRATAMKLAHARKQLHATEIVGQQQTAAL